MSNVGVENAAARSAQDNILHGSTAEGLMGKSFLGALSRPFMVHLRNGKVGRLRIAFRVLILFSCGFVAQMFVFYCIFSVGIRKH